MTDTHIRTIKDVVTDFLGSAPTLEEIAAYRLPADLQDRAHQLLDKNRKGILTPDERIEMDDFSQIDHRRLTPGWWARGLVRRCVERPLGCLWLSARCFSAGHDLHEGEGVGDGYVARDEGLTDNSGCRMSTYRVDKENSNAPIFGNPSNGRVLYCIDDPLIAHARVTGVQTRHNGDTNILGYPYGRVVIAGGYPRTGYGYTCII